MDVRARFLGVFESYQIIGCIKTLYLGVKEAKESESIWPSPRKSYILSRSKFYYVISFHSTNW